MDRPIDITGFSTDAAVSTPEHAPTIDGYQLLDQIGQGGMGTVWRALQLSTRRQVAIKIVSSGLIHSKRAIGRFEREVELTSRLQHANIARIYDSGLRQNVYFYAMELIEGKPLDEYVRDNKLSTRANLQLMRDIALAVQHAHQHGVVHRDLKPSNIVISEDGQPHVLDFGLAKSLLDTEQLAVSVDEQLLGTVEFMAPEQAAGRLDQIDTRTDIYSLGATLFLLLTGQLPRDNSGTRLERQRRIAEQEPRRPRSVALWIDSDLEALLVKALARQPDDRYASMAEFANDIQNYLNGDPVIAHKTTSWYFLRKRLRKHWFALSAVAAVLAIFIGLAIYSYLRIAAEKREAQNQAAIAQAVNKFLSDMLSSATPQFMLGGDKVTVVQAIEEATRKLDAGALKDQPLTEASVRYTIGTTLTLLSRNNEAEQNLRKSLALRQAFLPPLHEDIAITMDKLGVALAGEEREADAESILRQALALHLKMFSLEDSVEYSNDLSTVLLVERKLPEAEQIDRANLGFICKWAAVDPYFQGRIGYETDHLANVLKFEGNLVDAEVLCRQALEIDQKTLPLDHPDIGNCMMDLADILQRENKLDEAESLIRKALASERKILPAAHRRLIDHLKVLAAILRKEDKLAEAEATLREMVEMFPQLDLTVGRPYISALQELGAVLRSEEKMDEAEHFYREAFDQSCKSYRAGDTQIAPQLASLARMLQAAGKTKELAALCDGEGSAYRKAFTARRGTEPDDRPTLEAITFIGSLYDAARRYAEAEAQYRDAAFTAGKLFGEQSTEAKTARGHIADALTKQQKFEQAEILLLADYQILANRDAATQRPAIDRLVHLYEAWDKPASVTIWKSKRQTSSSSATKPATPPS